MKKIGKRRVDGTVPCPKMASNRKITLDKALQRRIVLKVEFDRPDQGRRRLIWDQLLSKKMPKAPDIDLDELCREDLVGGDIKNVFLNAARSAIRRDDRGMVTMQDFREAIVMERVGQWNGEKQGRIGFGG